MVKAGQIVKVHVLSVDPKSKRIALSMKTQGAKPAPKPASSQPPKQRPPQPTMDDKLAALADRWKKR